MANQKASTSVEDQQEPHFKDWQAFVDAKLIPVTITCEVIPGHHAEEACKTRLTLKARSVVDHVQHGHGGGFQFKVKQTNLDKAWEGWMDLANAGYVIRGVKCDVCDGWIKPSARELNNHLRTHQGKFRGAYQNYRNNFLLVLQHKDANVAENVDDPLYNE